MRKRDKLRNIEKANILAEQRYLASSEITEDVDIFGHNGISPFMDVHKDGTFSDEDKEPVEADEAVTENRAITAAVNNPVPPAIAQEKDKPQPTEGAITEDVDPTIIMNMIEAGAAWVKGGGIVNVGGESIPKNLATLIMGIMPTAAASTFITTFWGDIKAKLGIGGLKERSPTTPKTGNTTNNQR